MTAPRRLQIWLAGGLLLIPAAAAAAPVPPPTRADDPVRAVLSLPADSVDARSALIREDPAAFRAAFDSVLAASGPSDPRFSALGEVALAYLEATGDSLLVADHRFVAGAALADRKAWYRAVKDDARGMALQRAGEAEASIPLLERAASTYRRVGHLRREAVAWGSLGVSHFNRGGFEEAGKAYDEALAARMRLGDPVLLGRTLNALGSVRLQLADYPAALAYYRRALAVRETLGNPVDLGTTLAYLGNVHYRLGELEEARACYLRALDTLGPDAPDRALHPPRQGLANVLSDLGEIPQAVALYRESAARLEEHGDTLQAAQTRQSLAVVLLREGEHAEALRQLARVRDVQEASGASYDLATTWNTQGSVYADLGDYPRALDAFQKAEGLARESENPRERGSALQNLGFVYAEMGLLDRAVEQYREALSILRPIGDPGAVRSTLSDLAIAVWKQGRLDEALAYSNEALALDLETRNLPLAAQDYGNLGNVLEDLKRLDEAAASYRRGIELARRYAQSEALWACYLGTAHVHEVRGDLDSARVYNALAIRELEGVRGQTTEALKTSVLGQRAYVYEAQVHVLAKLHARHPDGGFAEEAFAVAERGKARAFSEILAEGRVRLDAGVPSPLAARRQELERSLNAVRYRLRLVQETGAAEDTVRALERRQRGLEDEAAALAERIDLESPRSGSRTGGAPRDAAAVRQALLGKGEALLEFALGDSASYLWVVTGDGVALHRLPTRETIETAVRGFRKGLTDPTPSGDADLLGSGTALYALLFGGVSGLDRWSRVYVVPDGALQFVPFEALLTRAVEPPAAGADPAARNRYFAALPYAFGRTRLVYGPSATALAALEAARRAPGHGRGGMDLFAVGDPAYAESTGAASAAAVRAGLAPLPFSRDEVEAIGAFFLPAKRTLLLGPEAREAAVADSAISRYRILHFATHGLVDERRPERSSLALSHPRDAGEDGYLQASEIYRLPLDADLVVLSACETGLGRMVRGEGVLGLPRAFFFAGARSVMVSLWSVSDRSTADLMTAFYRELVKEKRRPAEALERAKTRVRGSAAYAHPFYWAPFVLLGPA